MNFRNIFKKSDQVGVKELPSLEKICDATTRYSIYGLIFLLPLFFLPWTQDVLEFNKQMLLVVLVFVALFAWVIKSFILGALTINASRAHILVGVFFLVYVVSTAFSVLRYGSMWGWPQVASESLLSVMCFCIVYFLVSTVFSQKEVINSFLVMLSSFFIAAIYGALQLLGWHVMGAGFARIATFNSVGSIGTLGLWAALMLPISLILLIISKKWVQILSGACLVLLFLVLVLVNYGFLWWLVLMSSCLVVCFWVMRRDAFDGKWMFVPTFFIIVSLFFILANPQFTFLNKKSVEISLSQKTSLAIGWHTLLRSPLVGSGPGSFSYDALLYKNPELNRGSFWNVQFSVGASKFLTMLATVGTLGVLGLLALTVYALYYGIRKFMFDKTLAKSYHSSVFLVLLVFLMTATLAGFLYNFNLVLDLFYFFAIGALVAMTGKNNKTYILKPSSLMTLGITVAFTVVCIVGAGFVILEGQRYLANVSYSQALSALASKNQDRALQKMEQAASIDDADVYFRQLAQMYLLKAQSVLKSNPAQDSDAAKNLQVLISNAINASKRATDLNPKDVNNWAVRGVVYENLIGAIATASDWAQKSYDEAIKLDPKNPYYLLQKGVIYYQGKDYQNAQKNLETALALKPDYADVLYVVGLTYDQLGQKQKALDSFNKLFALDPQNATMKKILDNLKAGKPALEGLAQKPLTPSITNSPETSTPEKK